MLPPLVLVLLPLIVLLWSLLPLPLPPLSLFTVELVDFAISPPHHHPSRGVGSEICRYPPRPVRRRLCGTTTTTRRRCLVSRCVGLSVCTFRCSFVSLWSSSRLQCVVVGEDGRDQRRLPPVGSSLPHPPTGRSAPKREERETKTK